MNTISWPLILAIMVMTIDIPDQIIRQAEANALTVEQLLHRMANSDHEPDLTGLVPWGVVHESPEAASEARKRAANSMCEIASRNTLGGTTIRELINEGRKH